MAEKALLIDENQRSKMDEVLHSDVRARTINISVLDLGTHS